MRARLYPFAGTDGEYIELLESIVVRFNERHSSYTGPPTDILPPITSANACSEPPRLPAACSLRKRKRKRSPERSHFIQWNPVESTTGSTEPPESRRNPVESTTRSAEPPESRWKKVARRLIKATPDATNWKAAIRKANLYGIIGTDNAASYLLDEGGAVSSSLVVNALEDGSLDLLDRVRRYATSTSERKASASTLVKLAVFQQFLLLSACVVLLDTGTIPQDAVMDIVKICIGEKSRTYCQRILNAVKYINCLLDNLNGHGWGHRAAELILLWAYDPVSYYHLACSAEESLKFLRQNLTTPRFLMPEDQAPTRTRLFIPGLVYQVLNTSISMRRISEALGYKHSVMFASNPWLAFS